MKKVIAVLVVLVLVGLAFPLSNLIGGPRAGTALTTTRTDDPRFAKVAAMAERKCLDCHSKSTRMPFYAKLPIAKDVIEADIREGLSRLDVLADFLPKAGKPVSEVVLARTEYVVNGGTMPPIDYVLMHWDAKLSAADKADLLSWIEGVRVQNYATAGVPREVQKGVIQPLPQKVDEDSKKVALGRQLFHDTRLSGDDTISCASCHSLAKGGTDQERFSKGIGGKRGGINAPTVFNSGYQFIQFWDGRAADLAEQADGPVNNPIEMASNWEQVTEKLNQDEAFTRAFQEVYPDGYAKKNFVDAIAAFERTLITPNSRFDRFLLGKTDALTADEKQGYQVFLDRGCAKCHVGRLVGGQSFERMGEAEDYFADRGNPQKPDFGRYNVTKRDEDRFHLKVPTLRNIALTYPYLHDGTISDLAEAVRVMARYQLGEPLTDPEVSQVTKFLKALTGEYEGKLLE